MQFRQFVNDDLGCASYLIGDESSGEAVVVDPAYAIEPYLAEAEKRHVQDRRASSRRTRTPTTSPGAGRFALEHGASVHVHPAAQPEYAHEPLEDGLEISLGDVKIRVVRTPGQRPEHCCFTVIDSSRGEEPWLVITGDSLLIGDAAQATWPARRPRARPASTAACRSCSSSQTASSSTPAMWPARSAAPA